MIQMEKLLEREQNQRRNQKQRKVSDTTERFQFQAYKIGLATFKGKYTKREIHKLVTSRKGKFLCQEKWIIQGKHLQKDQWVQIFDMIEFWQCKELQIFSTTMQDIPQKISHIRFDCLTWLNFQKNNIKSIESLSFVNAVFLKRLLLGDNKIISLQPLDKMKLPLLQLLQLYNNQFSFIELSRTYLANKQKRFYLRINVLSQGKVFNSIQHMAKLQPQLMSTVMRMQLERYCNTNIHKQNNNQINLDTEEQIIPQVKVVNSLVKRFGLKIRMRGRVIRRQ